MKTMVAAAGAADSRHAPSVATVPAPRGRLLPAAKRTTTRYVREAVLARITQEDPVLVQENSCFLQCLNPAGTGNIVWCLVNHCRGDGKERTVEGSRTMIKWIAPTIMALSVMGGIAAPVLAADYDRNIPVRRADDKNNRRGELTRRMEDETSRINRMFDDGRLNRTHRDRALSKLQRIRDDVKHLDRFDEDRFRADQDVMNRLDRDLDNWSRHDHR
jgi:hypothetical protein